MGWCKMKKAFITFNVMLLIVGGVLWASGVYAFLKDVDTIELANFFEDGTYGSFRTPSLLESMAWMAIGSGVFMVFLAVVAFVGVRKELKWVLNMYAGVLIVVLLVVATIACLGLVLVRRINDHLKDALFDGIVNQYEGYIKSDNDFSIAFDAAQVQFTCCGVNNYTDFYNNATYWVDYTSNLIPKTCCKLDEYQYIYEREYEFLGALDCTRFPNSLNSNIDDQCYDDIKESLLSKTVIILVLSCAAALIQIFSIILGCRSARTWVERQGGQSTSTSSYTRKKSHYYRDVTPRHVASSKSSGRGAATNWSYY